MKQVDNKTCVCEGGVEEGVEGIVINWWGTLLYIYFFPKKKSSLFTLLINYLFIINKQFYIFLLLHISQIER